MPQLVAMADKVSPDLTVYAATLPVQETAEPANNHYV